MTIELLAIIALSAFALYLLLRKTKLPAPYVRPDTPEETAAKKLLEDWANNPANPDAPNFTQEAYDKLMAEMPDMANILKISTNK